VAALTADRPEQETAEAADAPSPKDQHLGAGGRLFLAVAGVECAVIRRIPGGRRATPEDVANAVLFPASDQASSSPASA
jgi:hypothetical protein